MARVALVVDDSMLIRHTVCRFLEQRGFAVESASNGMEALDILSNLQPTLIITDLTMPKMGGDELISSLKSKPETAAIPIVILSSKSSRTPQVADTRAQFVIYKDIDIEQQLEKAVQTLCGA